MKRVCGFLPLALAVAVLCPEARANARLSSVALVTIRGVPAFDAVRSGLTDEIPGALIVELEPDLSDARAELEELQRLQPSAVVVLGTPAALAVDEYLPATPRLFAMVLDAGRLGPPRRNRSGFTLSLDPAARIGALQKLITPLSNILVLRGPDGEAESLALTRFGGAVGITVRVVTIENAARLEKALAGITGEAQVVVLTTEALFLKDEVNEALLLRAFEARLPVVGFTERQVRLGGMASLEIDYRDHGRELARAAIVLGSGSETPQVRPASSYHWILNSRSARALNVSIPGDILSEAGEGTR